MRIVKCVVVGDYDAEKTRLLFAFTSKYLLTYVPTVLENYTKTLTVRGEEIELSLWDTAGQHDYDRLRPLSYPQTDVFVLCLSVVSPSACKNVRKKWVPEITHHCPGVPFLLVGTRTELRDDRSVLEELEKDKQRPLQPEDGERLAREIGAVKYMECSAETKEGVREVFEEAASAALEKDTTSKKKKCILQ